MISGVLAVVVWFFTLIVGGCFGIWVGWGLGADHEAEEQYRLERHTHRRGDPAPGVLIELPRSGRLALEPDPDDWRFFGESAQGWASESAEYELLTQTADDRHDTCPRCPSCGEHRHGGKCLTQTAEQPVSVTGEPPIDTGELLAITDRVESWIAQWTAQGNIDRHTIQAGE